MAGKYPQLSPYNFSGNNPVLFVDYDGNDFGLKIDHANKTIIVVANIYTIGKNTMNFDYAEKAAAVWEAQKYDVEGYTVSFEVNVIDIQEELPSFEKFLETSSDKMKEKWTTVSKKGKTKVDLDKARDIYGMRLSSMLVASDANDHIGNRYMGSVGGEPRNGPGRAMGTLNGTEMFTDWDESTGAQFAAGALYFAHELGHIFGLDDYESKTLDGKYYKGEYYSPNGIMRYTQPLQPIHLDDVKNIMRYAIDALNKGGSKIDGKDSGRLPNRFKGDGKPSVMIIEEKGNGSFKDLKIKE